MTDISEVFSDEGYNSLDGESYLDYSEQSVVNDDSNRGTIKDDRKVELDRSKVLDSPSKLLAQYTGNAHLEPNNNILIVGNGKELLNSNQSRYQSG